MAKTCCCSAPRGRQDTSGHRAWPRGHPLAGYAVQFVTAMTLVVSLAKAHGERRLEAQQGDLSLDVEGADGVAVLGHDLAKNRVTRA
jgi:hypothetical protein